MSALSSSHAKLSYYHYEPNLGGNIFFAVIYGLCGAAAIGQFVYYRSWFWWPFILASVMEMIGYIDRVPSTQNVQNRTMFIIQYVMIILAPAVVASAYYMAYARIIYWVTPEKYRSFKHMWVPARWITPIFVSFDVVSFGIQLVGASLIAASQPWETDKLNKGKRIVRIGLVFQLICFGFFTFVAARFIFVSRKFKDSWPKSNWLHLLYAVNVACALVLLRSIYRMVEYSMGLDAYPSTNEWMFFVFDSVLVWIALAIFNFIHPGMYLPNLGIRKQRVYTGRKSVQEMDLCQLVAPSDAEAAKEGLTPSDSAEE